MTEREVFKKVWEKLKADNYVYWFPPRTWGERDIMGVFDFIAAKGRKFIFVQVTTIQHISDRRKKIQNFYIKNDVGPLPDVYIWAYDPRKDKFKIEKQ